MPESDKELRELLRFVPETPEMSAVMATAETFGLDINLVHNLINFHKEVYEREMERQEDFDKPVHRWFSLSYASYAVVPRSIAQSMPTAWQRRFVEVMEDLDAMCIKHGISTPDYHCHGRDGGKYATDPYRNYDRGRRDVFREKTGD